jgi:hypothetical protein
MRRGLTIQVPGCLLGPALLGLSLWFGGGTAAWARTPDHTTAIATASVTVLSMQGHPVHTVHATTTIQFSIRLVVPRSFPAGYTDTRFVVLLHARAQRTIIYGTPKHVHPGDVVQVILPTTISKSWVGTVTVRGIIRLLAKPGGAALGYKAQGTTQLTVTR